MSNRQLKVRDTHSWRHRQLQKGRSPRLATLTARANASETVEQCALSKKRVDLTLAGDLLLVLT